MAAKGEMLYAWTTNADLAGKAECGQREGDRVADQHEHDQAAEHQRRHPFQRDHCTGRA